AIVCLARYPSVSRRRGVDRNPRMPELHGPDDVAVMGAGAITFHVPASVAGWNGGGKRGVGSTGSAYGNSICHDVRGHRSFRWTGRDQMASAHRAAPRRTRATHRARVNLSDAPKRVPITNCKLPITNGRFTRVLCVEGFRPGGTLFRPQKEPRMKTFFLHSSLLLIF